MLSNNCVESTSIPTSEYTSIKVNVINVADNLLPFLEKYAEILRT